MEFLDIWGRVKKETDIKTLTALAKFLETTQQYVSRKKSNNDFSVKWAFKIAQKYKLNTDWVMTGKGMKKISDLEEKYKNPFLKDIDKWLHEQILEEPFRKEWFVGNFLDAFPKFAEWKRNLGQDESENHSDRNSKAA